MSPQLELAWLEGRFAICRMPSQAPRLPAGSTSFFSISRTPDELSIVCEVAAAPPGATVEGPYALFRVTGKMELGLTGVLASLAGPLATADLPLFAVSTFDTDYILIRDADRASAEAALLAAGHRFIGA